MTNPKLEGVIGDYRRFLAEPHLRNAWLGDRSSPLEVYVRKAMRNQWRDFDNELKLSLDIASIEVKEPGQGLFTEFLGYVEVHCPYTMVYIENILTPRFVSFLTRRGYTRVLIPGSSLDDPPSLMKRIEPVVMGDVPSIQQT